MLLEANPSRGKRHGQTTTGANKASPRLRLTVMDGGCEFQISESIFLIPLSVSLSLFKQCVCALSIIQCTTITSSLYIVLQNRASTLYSWTPPCRWGSQGVAGGPFSQPSHCIDIHALCFPRWPLNPSGRNESLTTWTKCTSRERSKSPPP